MMLVHYESLLETGIELLQCILTQMALKLLATHRQIICIEILLELPLDMLDPLGF